MALRVPLVLHPDSECAVTGIEAEVARANARRLEVTFFVSGGARHVRGSFGKHADLPRDELWKSTCFELFLRAEGDSGYYEVNLAPSGRWMSFHFTDYRVGRTDADGTIEVTEGGWCGGKKVHFLEPYPGSRRTDARNEAYVPMLLDLERAHDLTLEQPWRIGLSAVIEEYSGRKSYWALAHPPGPPDFHAEACFALELPPARPA